MYAHAQAPVRIGIAGGGTDLPAWASERRGLCLSLAINTHAHAAAITRADRQVVVSYRERHTASAATEVANGLIRESALAHGWLDGFEVHTLSEVTSYGSGLGVSSAFAVCLAAVFSRMRLMSNGYHDDADSKDAIAASAWGVEIDRLRRPIGRQDHMAATHGGLRLYSFEEDRAAIEHTFSEEDAAWVAGHLVLVRLPEGHDSRAILSNVKRAVQVEEAFAAVDVARRAIEGRDATALGRALSMGQAAKMSIPGAVPDWLREVVRKIGETGAVYGCKVTGAGGGGHVVAACEPDTATRLGRDLGLEAFTVRPDFHGVRSEGCL